MRRPTGHQRLYNGGETVRYDKVLQINVPVYSININYSCYI